MDTEEQVKLFAEWVDECRPKGMVFFGGAGVSTESGIPDFRSQDGLYNQKYSYPPEVMVSHSFFWNHTKEFYDFYFDKMIFDEAKPNAAHLKLAELEKAGKLSAVVTQNIDGLHQAAGSENVLELHGTVHQNYCTQCNAFYDLADTKKAHDDCPDGIPHCPKCGGIIKPDVVLYEEPLNQRITAQAIEAISEAELLVIAGTSLVVYPAAGMIDYFHGKHLVIVNLTPTQADRTADLCICEKVGKVFKAL
ncbi:MAG: NAD-dependent protein deacylase [Phoenicibacter congonensis]|uniref:NAD-dependent protein deacetylase n=1 Tax=Phoenicibacter congonensis TaxID=1944646 RepID=A0AA43UBE4_9ACTN|nr:NAD-dependent protein deacylase [Phoenicibacter congonensis]